MVERTLKQEAEEFLIEYGGQVLAANSLPAYERIRALGKLRAVGVKRIKGLVAEFGKGE